MITDEDIKIGEYYIVLGRVGYKNENEVSVTFSNKFGVQTSIEFEHKRACEVLFPIPEQPKYDPCRKFRKGDIVKPRKLFGRYYSKATARIIGKVCTVLHDEIEHYSVNIRWNEGEYNIDPAYLELVTPVEELEPYSVVQRQEIDEPDNYLPYYAVVSSGCEVARFYVEQYLAGQAKEAAEAECARLNAEYRKENSHE